METVKLKFIDLFAGIGGFRLGFEQANYQCVYSSEVDEACQKVYFYNFGDTPDGDITKVNIQEIPDFDVLTAGFPCQPFSISGKQQGFEDTRGTLFFHICEVIKAKKPKAIVLENVKHLVHLSQGKTLDVILYSLESLGYLVDYKILNAKNFGVPQNRERIIIVATQDKKFDFNKISYSRAIPKLRDFLSKKENFEYLNPTEYTLIKNFRIQESGLVFIGYRNKSIRKAGVRPNTHHLSRVHHQPNRIYSIDGLHPTIPSQETSGRFFIYLPEENAVRKLTLQECYRLMGFPSDFKIHHNLQEAYKQIGNSICIPMVKEIALQLKNHIFEKNIIKKEGITYKNNQFLSKPLQLKINGLNIMDHRQKLLEIYENLIKIDNIENDLPEEYQNYIQEISINCYNQKGVFTVLITLLIHKILNPNQDIRYHQASMKGGFSGRTIDTQYITPTLKELGLPAMAETGWLTRSLEQPYPYTLDYNGKIRQVKTPFLNLIDFAQKNPSSAEDIVKLLLNQVIKIISSNKIEIIKLDNPEILDVETIVNCLYKHFNYDYKTHNTAKLPILAIYAIYKRLIEEVERYKSCSLKPLGSHTASDRTSKSSGDIEILDKNQKLVEAVEIKFGKPISLQMILVAQDKIIKYNPRRYYILSTADLKLDEVDKIKEQIKQIAKTHGCQVIVNGIIPTLKYYLRLITSLENFINEYSDLVSIDKEIHTIHKTKWNKILLQLNS